MGLCPTMAPSTPFVQRPSFACRINQLPARKNWPCHLVAAVEHRSGNVLGQEAVAHKSNEIPTVRSLAIGLDLQGLDWERPEVCAKDSGSNCTRDSTRAR